MVHTAIFPRVYRYYMDNVRDNPNTSNFLLQTFIIKPISFVVIEVLAVATLVEGTVRLIFSLFISPFMSCIENPDLHDVYNRHFSLGDCDSAVCESLSWFLPYIFYGIYQLVPFSAKGLH